MGRGTLSPSEAGDRIDSRFHRDASAGVSLLVYRWLSLALVYVLLAGGTTPLPHNTRTWLVLAAATAYTLLVTAFWGRVVGLLNRVPALIGVDIIVCSLLLASSVGWRSPYYLYAMSPIITGAYLFEVRGGLLVAAVHSIGYTVAITVNGFTPARVARMHMLDSYISHYFVYLAVALFIGYLSMLLNRLRVLSREIDRYRAQLADMNERLAGRNKQLVALNSVGAALQSSLELKEVLQRVLSGFTDGMGFERALIGLVTSDSGDVVEWQGSASIPADCWQDLAVGRVDREGACSRSIAEGRVVSGPAGGVGLEPVLARIMEADESGTSQGVYAVLPLIAKGETVGVAVVGGNDPEAVTDGGLLELAKSLASQAAVAIYNARLHEETQELARVRERNRIAVDMHDTVVQSLSGGLLLLDSVIKKMTGREVLENRLVQLHGLLSASLKDIRSCIFNLRADTLDDLSLSSYLREYLRRFSQETGLAVEYRASGQERMLPNDVKHAVHKIVQEALVNVVKHAAANRVSVALDYRPEALAVEIHDDGLGFDCGTALAQSGERQSLGLTAMSERAEGLGGRLEVLSRPGAGCRITASVPFA